jgi:hypothetical protein
LFSDTDLSGNVRYGTTGINDQTHSLLATLRGVLLAVSRHGNILPAEPAVPRSDVHHQGSTPTASITREAAEELGLAEGTATIVLVKSSEVALAVD